jgi:uncharacterized delta-60 repeat protein
MAALMRFGPLSLVGVLALGIVAGAVAAPGDLDPTFGTGGRVGLSPYVESVGVAAVLQPDGKILLAGWADDVAPPPPPPPAPFGLQASNADFLAVRLTPNGSLDLPFGRDGTVRTPIDLGNSTGDFAWAVAPGPDGTVVLAGNAGTQGGSLDFAFVRYTSTGALDSSFSGDGVQTVDDGTFDYIRGVAVQPDGKIVAVGRGSGDGIAVIRLLANGARDTSFGNGGIVNTVIGDPTIQDEATAVLLVEGTIVVAGVADWQNPTRTAFAVVRYLSNGQLDRSFGAGGISVGRPSYDQRAAALATAPGGKIVVAGQAPGTFVSRATSPPELRTARSAVRVTRSRRSTAPTLKDEGLPCKPTARSSSGEWPSPAPRTATSSRLRGTTSTGPSTGPSGGPGSGPIRLERESRAGRRSCSEAPRRAAETDSLWPEWPRLGARWPTTSSRSASTSELRARRRSPRESAACRG